MPTKDKKYISEMLLDPNCLPEYFDPFIGGATDTIKRLTTKTIKAAKPKVKPVRKPETFRPNTVMAMGQTLKTIDNEIQKERDPTRLAKLQSDFYKLSKKIDSESERILNNKPSEVSHAHRSRPKKYI
jgi:hypothetical protein